MGVFYSIPQFLFDGCHIDRLKIFLKIFVFLRLLA